ncbi:MAG: DUF4232 domain-containing protein [Actinomycetota bacterium]|jgi:hypothetical protein|nr:DUF4232 domain-containing protein [Actinomycetota bacterium]MDA8314037.1 DUF4232 domain-containing protein [Actinomycetota bacterium]
MSRRQLLVAGKMLLGTTVLTAVALAGIATAGVTPAKGRTTGATAITTCRAAQLVVGGLGSSTAAGTVIVTVRVTNVSRTTCSVAGRPMLSFVSASGRTLRTSIGHHGPGVAFATPKRVMLTPATSAGFVFTSLDDVEERLVCHEARAVHLRLPGVAGERVVQLADAEWPYALCALPPATATVNVSALVPAKDTDSYAPARPACTGAGLHIQIGDERAASGTAAFTATVVDRSADCTLVGYPTLSLLAASGKTILRFVPGQSVMALSSPALPRPVTLRKGGRAMFSFAAGDDQPTADAGRGAPCPLSTTVHIAFPGGGSMTIHRRLRLCGFGGVGAFTAV